MNTGLRSVHGVTWYAARAPILLALAIGCRDVFTAPTDPARPEITGLLVTAGMIGIDHPKAYAVAVDNGPPQPVGAGETIPIRRLSPGRHAVAVRDVPPNCNVEGENPLEVMVVNGSMTQVGFVITCVSVTGSVAITVAASGLDMPGVYSVQVGERPPLVVFAALPAIFTDLSGGEHVVALRALSANCAVAGANPRTLSVTTGGLTRDVTPATFDVTCGATTGVIEVAIQTSGDDPPIGYTLQVGQVTRREPAQAISRFGVAGGDHAVRLDSVGSNCTVAGSNPRTMPVSTGGLARDTARTAFQVSCVRVDKIAFTRYVSGSPPQVAVAHADGSNAVLLFEGHSASWSPNGTKLVFTGVEADWYYYDDYFDTGLFVAAADGASILRLSSDPRDHDPNWSPDGSKIAFVRADRLYTMSASGAVPAPVISPAALPADLGSVAQPSWSPDGTRIAFTCRMGTLEWSDICVVNADGTGFLRLMSDPWTDSRPTWSPDGVRIAFTTNHGTTSGEDYIGMMSFGGTGITRIATGRDPNWSRDGSKIVFAGYGDARGLFTVKPDGTGLVRLTREHDHAPLWRP